VEDMSAELTDIRSRPTYCGITTVYT